MGVDTNRDGGSGGIAGETDRQRENFASWRSDTGSIRRKFVNEESVRGRHHSHQNAHSVSNSELDVARPRHLALTPCGVVGLRDGLDWLTD